MKRSQLEFVAKCKNLCADIDEGGNYWASADLSPDGRRLNIYAFSQDSDWFKFDYLLDIGKPNLDHQSHAIKLLEALL